MLKILSLGAGVQSSTIFKMSCLGEIEKLDAAVFADTGWEPRAVYYWLKKLRLWGETYGIPVYVVSKGNIKEDALKSQINARVGGGKRWASMPYRVRNKDGTIGMIRRQCTKEYKIEPLEKKYRDIAGYKPRQRIPIGTVEVWKGISIDEANRCSFSRKKWIAFYYPLIELRMDRNSCIEWWRKKNLPVPPRSACIGCPYRNNPGWREMRNNRPEEWKDAVAFDKKIRKCNLMVGDVFIHRDCIPLDEVNLDKDKNQLMLFADECAGVCGV